MSGRLHRFSQQLVALDHFPHFILLEFLELLRDGYSLRQVRKLWFTRSAYGTKFHLGLAVLNELALRVDRDMKQRTITNQSFHACMNLSKYASSLNSIIGHGQVMSRSGESAPSQSLLGALSAFARSHARLIGVLLHAFPEPTQAPMQVSTTMDEQTSFAAMLEASPAFQSLRAQVMESERGLEQTSDDITTLGF